MKRFLLIAFCLVALAACSHPGARYVGKWVDMKSPSNVVNISDNGGTMTVEVVSPNVWNGAQETEKFVGVAKDGQLQVKAEMGTISFVIVKSTGHLIGGGDEYKRAN